MKLKFFFCALFIALAIQSFGQDTNLKSYGKIGFGFSGLDVSWDIPVSDKILFEAAAGLGAGYFISSGDYNYKWYLDDPVAFFTLHGKYYINRTKRLKQGKSIDLNTGSFIGIKAKYVTQTLRYSFNWKTLLIAAHWGMQRPIGKHFSYEFYAGLGYAVDMSEYNDGGCLYPDLNIRISYILPFTKK
ncbi:MAG: hypothetical protein LBN74_09555 [Prevotella sp.]|jgi:hypothetical protein|nr:hypothetical protein [Prevotella sp.]